MSLLTLSIREGENNIGRIRTGKAHGLNNSTPQQQICGADLLGGGGGEWRDDHGCH